MLGFFVGLLNQFKDQISRILLGSFSRSILCGHKERNYLFVSDYGRCEVSRYIQVFGKVFLALLASRINLKHKVEPRVNGKKLKNHIKIEIVLIKKKIRYRK